MKILISLALLIWISSNFAFAQSSYYPSECKRGDVTDSYDGHWMACTDTNHWVKLPPYDVPMSWVCYGNSGDPCPNPYLPNCRLVFKDVDGNWHCPWETATGRVVACAPCPKDAYNQKSCGVWYKECLDFVQIQKTHFTTEPTELRRDTVRIDHTPDGIFVCPDEYTLHWYNRDHFGTSPVCMRPK